MAFSSFKVFLHWSRECLEFYSDGFCMHIMPSPPKQSRKPLKSRLVSRLKSVLNSKYGRNFMNGAVEFDHYFGRIQEQMTILGKNSETNDYFGEEFRNEWCFEEKFKNKRCFMEEFKNKWLFWGRIQEQMTILGKNSETNDVLRRNSRTNGVLWKNSRTNDYFGEEFKNKWCFVDFGFWISKMFHTTENQLRTMAIYGA